MEGNPIENYAYWNVKNAKLNDNTALFSFTKCYRINLKVDADLDLIKYYEENYLKTCSSGVIIDSKSIYQNVAV